MNKICDCCKRMAFCMQHKITMRWYCVDCFKHTNEIINEVNSQTQSPSKSQDNRSPEEILTEEEPDALT